MMDGWIKVHRKIVNWGWYGDPNTKAVFLHLLLTANFRDTQYKGVTIHAGQTVIGRKALAEVLGISEQNVRTALNHLKSTNEITIDVTNKFSVVTIVNWESYQLADDELTNELTNNVTNDQPTTNQQLTNNQPHLKNDKNIKNDKNDKKNIYIHSGDAKEIIAYLNEMVGASYKSTTKKTRDLISARMNEGFTVGDFKTVIYKKAKQWNNDPKMCKFLRPETLFSNKFEGYLNEKEPVAGARRWDTA